MIIEMKHGWCDTTTHPLFFKQCYLSNNWIESKFKEKKTNIKYKSNTHKNTSQLNKQTNKKNQEIKWEINNKNLFNNHCVKKDKQTKQKQHFKQEKNICE